MTDAKETGFRVGDRVAIVDRVHGVKIRKVLRVLKSFVELDNKSRWSHHGSPYPRGSGWGAYSAKLQPLTPELESRARAKPISDNLRRVDWRQLDLKTLEAVQALVDAAGADDAQD